MRKLLIVLLAACGEVGPMEAELGAVPYDAPPIYREWWAQVESCSGKTGDFDAVRWFEVPGDYLPNSFAGARSDYAAQTVVVAANRKLEANVVRHEALHLLLKTSGHPPEYFGDPQTVGVCMNLVE
jgi:hypothetical protein